jgi:hypothetical protein
MAGSTLGKVAIVGVPLFAIGSGILVQRRCKQGGESCLGAAAVTSVLATVVSGILLAVAVVVGMRGVRV